MGFHRNSVIYRVFALAVSVLFFYATQALCRLRVPAYMLDIRALAEAAPIVFRGRIAETGATVPNRSDGSRPRTVATFRVDRVYRGRVAADVELHFTYSSISTGEGHDCINFQPNTYWLVFARQTGDGLELTDDCDGALPVSALLGPDLTEEGWLNQMEADFTAELADRDPSSRLISIQRLGGLGLPGSREALHQIMKTGDKDESGWAIYALLRTGDATVLPGVEQLLQNGDDGPLKSAIALQLKNVSDRDAVPGLISILQNAPGKLTRCSILTALGETLRDPRAVPSLAAHLSDPDPYARYDALDGLRNLTHENACTLPQDWHEQDIEPQESKCSAWWEQQGRFQSRTGR
ncbi:MAG TPA: HEAT repeat domain-containing protein [Candidatus Acidoferrales bacterium]|nr:HEAT repeat domain-containing protein [Candidatus Acidoferrales bacterium]